MDTSPASRDLLAETAQLTGLPAFLRAARIRCCQRLGDITAALDPGSEEHAVALRGGLRPDTR